MAALSRRGALQALLTAGVAVSLPAVAAAAQPAPLTDAWRAFAESYRLAFPTIDGACAEASRLGYGPDDVYAMCRAQAPRRGVFLTVKGAEGQFWMTGAH